MSEIKGTEKSKVSNILDIISRIHEIRTTRNFIDAEKILGFSLDIKQEKQGRYAKPSHKIDWLYDMVYYDRNEFVSKQSIMLVFETNICVSLSAILEKFGKSFTFSKADIPYYSFDGNMMNIGTDVSNGYIKYERNSDGSLDDIEFYFGKGPCAHYVNATWSFPETGSLK